MASFGHRVAGVAMTKDGRYFGNLRRRLDNACILVAAVLADDTLRSYPGERWSGRRNAKAEVRPVEDRFVCVQSVVPGWSRRPLDA